MSGMVIMVAYKMLPCVSGVQMIAVWKE